MPYASADGFEGFTPAVSGPVIVETRDVLLADLSFDPAFQVREGTNQEALERYAAAMLAGVTFPPLLVVRLPSQRLQVIDGYHRGLAAREIRLQRLTCRIAEGTAQDAEDWAFEANREHGLAYTSADRKRRFLQLVQRSGTDPMFSITDTARRCDVPLRTARRWYDEWQASREIATSKTVGAHGTMVSESPVSVAGSEAASEVAPQFKGQGQTPLPKGSTTDKTFAPSAERGVRIDSQLAFAEDEEGFVLPDCPDVRRQEPPAAVRTLREYLQAVAEHSTGNVADLAGQVARQLERVEGALGGGE